MAQRPSNLGMVRGPLVVSGGYCPHIPAFVMPLMLPHETNPFEFVVSSGAEFDPSNEDVDKLKQVDNGRHGSKK